MTKHTDIKAVAYVFQVLGIITLVIALLYTVATQSIFFMIYGLIGFAWLYAIGGALLVLIDIAKSVRASAVVAIEQEDRREADKRVKSRPNINDRLLEKQRAKARTNKRSGLQKLSPEKRMNA